MAGFFGSIPNIVSDDGDHQYTIDKAKAYAEYPDTRAIALQDRFGGWIMVRAKERTAPSIVGAMEKGEFYLSQGPEIQDWGMEENTIYFRCSPCKEIHVTTYPTRGRSYYAEEGKTLTEIAYPLKGGEKYIRIECIDENGNTAWTNPFFF